MWWEREPRHWCREQGSAALVVARRCGRRACGSEKAGFHHGARAGCRSAEDTGRGGASRGPKDDPDHTLRA